MNNKKAKKSRNKRKSLVDKDMIKAVLLEFLAESAMGSLGKKNSTGKVKLLINTSEQGKIDEKLNMADKKIAEVMGDKSHSSFKREERELAQIEDLDEADLRMIKRLQKKGVEIIYPNLKYRKPKYKNIESILSYVESEGDRGETIKLVIMNFND